MDALRSLIPLAVLFIICDVPWLYVVAPWTQSMLKKIQGGSPLQMRLEGAIPVYLALAYLVQKTASTVDAFFMGLCVYAVYDFTNYALLKDYDIRIAVADSLWGGVLFTIVREIGLRFNLL